MNLFSVEEIFKKNVFLTFSKPPPPTPPSSINIKPQAPSQTMFYEVLNIFKKNVLLTLTQTYIHTHTHTHKLFFFIWPSFQSRELFFSYDPPYSRGNNWAPEKNPNYLNLCIQRIPLLENLRSGEHVRTKLVFEKIVIPLIPPQMDDLTIFDPAQDDVPFRF